jgi:hypothetical protein
MKIIEIVFLSAAMLLALSTHAHSAQIFPAIEITPNGKSEPLFQFSASAASSKDPVVISVANRELQESDRENRVELQKYWLHRNVPASYKLAARSLIKCPPRKPKQFGACDEYLFTDGTGAEHAYYFYVGNWP